jgi:chaperonin cofactor prefoldin
MDETTIPRWLTEHWPSLLNGGLVIALFKVYLDNKRLRSEVRHTDAQTAGEEADNVAKQVGGVTSIIAVYKSTTSDMVEKYEEAKAEVKSLRGQMKRRDARIDHLQQENELLREMKGLPPTPEDIGE